MNLRGANIRNAKGQSLDSGLQARGQPESEADESAPGSAGARLQALIRDLSLSNQAAATSHGTSAADEREVEGDSFTLSKDAPASTPQASEDAPPKSAWEESAFPPVSLPPTSEAPAAPSPVVEARPQPERPTPAPAPRAHVLPAATVAAKPAAVMPRARRGRTKPLLLVATFLALTVALGLGGLAISGSSPRSSAAASPAAPTQLSTPEPTVPVLAVAVTPEPLAATATAAPTATPEPTPPPPTATPEPALPSVTPVPAVPAPVQPGGTLVVVRKTSENTLGLYTMAPDGQSLTPLLRLPSRSVWAPSGSPDGQWLAVSTGNLNKGDVGIVRRDGGGFRVVVSGGDYALSSPWWMPDGRVAFTGTVGARSEVYATGLEGGTAAQITQTAGKLAETRIPSWPQQGGSMAFSARQGRFARVFIQLPDGGQRAVTPDGFDALTPVWSPDGKQIAFSGALPDGRAGIFTIAPEGSNLTQRAQAAPKTSACCAAWSPDGQWLAYVGDLGAGSDPNYGNLYVVPVGGGEPRRVLSDGATYYWRPAWLP